MVGESLVFSDHLPTLAAAGRFVAREGIDGTPEHDISVRLPFSRFSTGVQTQAKKVWEQEAPSSYAGEGAGGLEPMARALIEGLGDLGDAQLSVDIDKENATFEAHLATSGRLNKWLSHHPGTPGTSLLTLPKAHDAIVVRLPESIGELFRAAPPPAPEPVAAVPASAAAPVAASSGTSAPAGAAAPVAAAAPALQTLQRQPSSFENQMASLAQNIHQPALSSAVIPAPPAPVASVRPPSSLGAQLAELTQSPPAKMASPSYKLRGPETASGYEIQIGAFASPAEADKKLATVQNQMPILQGHKPLRQTVTVGDKTLHRARFAGFDQAAAQAACAQLNRASINCLALKAE